MSENPLTNNAPVNTVQGEKALENLCRELCSILGVEADACEQERIEPLGSIDGPELWKELIAPIEAYSTTLSAQLKQTQQWLCEEKHKVSNLEAEINGGLKVQAGRAAELESKLAQMAEALEALTAFGERDGWKGKYINDAKAALALYREGQPK